MPALVVIISQDAINGLVFRRKSVLISVEEAIIFYCPYIPNRQGRFNVG
jgi:hypothetical protein